MVLKAADAIVLNTTALKSVNIATIDILKWKEIVKELYCRDHISVVDRELFLLADDISNYLWEKTFQIIGETKKGVMEIRCYSYRHWSSRQTVLAYGMQSILDKRNKTLSNQLVWGEMTIW